MLQTAKALTNDQGRKFINTWILGDPIYKGSDIIGIIEQPGNFFIAVVDAPTRPAPHCISLPYAGSGCLPTFYGSLQHLEKMTGVKFIKG